MLAYLQRSPLLRDSAHLKAEAYRITYRTPSKCLWQKASGVAVCDRLVGYYAQQGVMINREPFAPSQAFGGCISHSVAVIEAVLAAKQGVKSLTLGYGQCGNLIQDVAAIQTLPVLAQVT